MTTPLRVRILIGAVSYCTEQMAAERLGWDYASIRRLVSKGSLKVEARLGRLPLLKEDAVLAYAKASAWASKPYPRKPKAPGSR